MNAHSEEMATAASWTRKKCERCNRIDAELAARVEAIPSEPEHARAQRHQGDRVRTSVRNLALAHIEDRRQSCDAGDVVDHNTACEIQDAPTREDAATPHP